MKRTNFTGFTIACGIMLLGMFSESKSNHPTKDVGGVRVYTDTLPAKRDMGAVKDTVRVGVPVFEKTDTFHVVIIYLGGDGNVKHTKGLQIAKGFKLSGEKDFLQGQQLNITYFDGSKKQMPASVILQAIPYQLPKPDSTKKK